MANGEGGGPAVIAGSAPVAGFVGDSLPGHALPAFWEAADPIAALRVQAGDSARVLITFGGAGIDPAMLDALPRLGLVLALGAGYDGIDPAVLAARGIQLANSGDANSDVVADHALALALAACRRTIEADAWVRSDMWAERRFFPMLPAFSARRAGIVGFGHIGREIAKRLAGFGIETRWWGPREKPGEALPRAASLLDLARTSSLLFVACPGGPETSRLIDAQVIDAVGPDGLIVSVARGSVIDEDALIAALKAGRLGGAALDVFETEPTPAQRWVDVPNTVLSPHQAGSTFESFARMQQALAENVRRFLAGEPVLHRIC